MVRDRFAKPGTVWVCAACGKTSTDLYGMEGKHSRGWDESCMLHAVLCHDDQRLDDLGRARWLPVGEAASENPASPETAA